MIASVFPASYIHIRTHQHVVCMGIQYVFVIWIATMHQNRDSQHCKHRPCVDQTIALMNALGSKVTSIAYLLQLSINKHMGHKAFACRPLQEPTICRINNSSTFGFLYAGFVTQSCTTSQRCEYFLC